MLNKIDNFALNYFKLNNNIASIYLISECLDIFTQSKRLASISGSLSRLAVSIEE